MFVLPLIERERIRWRNKNLVSAISLSFALSEESIQQIAAFTQGEKDAITKDALKDTAWYKTNDILVLGKTFRGIDIRDYGSHNLGATNAGRVLGRKYFFIVMILDAIKCGLGILIGYLLFSSQS